MHAVTLLERDHRRVAKLFEAFDDAEQDDRRMLAGRICRLLTLHGTLEEEMVYPLAREVLEEDDLDLAGEALADHAMMKRLIDEIEAGDNDPELLESRVKALERRVLHHIEEEEQGLLADLEYSGVDLEALGTKLAARRALLPGTAADEALDETTLESYEDEAHRSGESLPPIPSPERAERPRA